jgi:hypothetical protein
MVKQDAANQVVGKAPIKHDIRRSPGVIPAECPNFEIDQ